MSKRSDVSYVSAIFIVALSCLIAAHAAAQNRAPAAAILDWMRAHHVAHICVEYEVTNFDPASARLMRSTGHANLDDLVLADIRAMGKTWAGFEGDRYATYTKSPEVLSLQYNLNPRRFPDLSTGRNIGCADSDSRRD